MAISTRSQTPKAEDPTKPPAPLKKLNSRTTQALAPKSPPVIDSIRTTPPRGRNNFGTNTRSKLSLGAQGTLLNLISECPGGFLFIDSRLRDLLDTRPDLFGASNSRNALRRSVLDKLKKWKALPISELNTLLALHKISPLTSDPGDLPLAAAPPLIPAPHQIVPAPPLIEPPQLISSPPSSSPPPRPPVAIAPTTTGKTIAQQIEENTLQSDDEDKVKKRTVSTTTTTSRKKMPPTFSKPAFLPLIPSHARYKVHDVDWEYNEDNQGFKFYWLENVVYDGKVFEKILCVVRDSGIDLADVTSSRWQLRAVKDGDEQYVLMEHPSSMTNARDELERLNFDSQANALQCFEQNDELRSAFNKATMKNATQINDSELPPERRKTKGPNRAQIYSVFKIPKGESPSKQQLFVS
jgi:hypothetical protein